jgi:hypothetical protein
MKGNQNKKLNSLKLVQESRIYTLQNIPNNKDEERFPGFMRTAGSVMRCPNIVTYEKEKDAPILSAENGAEKTASCKKRQSDEC